MSKSPDEKQLFQAWKNAEQVPGENPDLVRADEAGIIMHFDQHGESSERFGWVIAEDNNGQSQAISRHMSLPKSTRRQMAIIKSIQVGKFISSA